MKNILEREGISYQEELNQLKNSINTETFETNQGSRIVFPNEITKDMANRFFARFWGRTDVYAKRVENKKTNKAGYYPQCINFWSDGCGKKWNAGFRCQDCHYQKYKALTIDSIKSHLKGNEIIGVYPLHKDNTCRFLVFDFDNHDKDAGNDFANIDDSWKEEVNAMREICQLNGIDPLIERSRSGKGAHIWIFFDKPISSILARNFGNALLDKGAEQVNLKSFKYYDRMIPAQDSMPKGGLGNLIALPLQGRALKDGNSAFIDENWNAYSNQWNILWSKPKLSQVFIEEKIKEWHGNSDDKPWDSMSEFEKNEVNGKMHITLSNGIYVDTSNLSVSIQNKIRKLARISNPIYYKNQGMGISTFGMYKYIYLGEDHNSGYIQIPRGCYDALISYNKNAEIQMMIDDKRQQGRSIDVTFKGELKPEQNVALNKMIEHDNGILLIGSQSKKENNHIVELMKSVPEDKTMILIATGSLVGEGFDLDRLDTLFLAMPVASSVIEQFTGRIHRLYDKKDTILVYDHVDVHIPMFDRMYGKRLKAYKKSGYELISDTNGIKSESQISQSIFDASNYYDMYSQDLLCANKNIIVSSPSLSGDRVVEFTKLIKEKMESGVEVTIVSWMPDKIRFGSSNYRMQLLEEMRQSGFYLKSAEDNCEHFAIIDQEIVWYGNINLLGKQDVEDHIMRIQSKEIASELMEMTFGNSLYNYLNNF